MLVYQRVYCLNPNLWGCRESAIRSVEAPAAGAMVGSPWKWATWWSWCRKKEPCRSIDAHSFANMPFAQVIHQVLKAHSSMRISRGEHRRLPWSFKPLTVLQLRSLTGGHGYCPCVRDIYSIPPRSNMPHLSHESRMEEQFMTIHDNHFSMLTCVCIHMQKSQHSAHGTSRLQAVARSIKLSLAMCRWPCACACCRPQDGRHGCKGDLDKR